MNAYLDRVESLSRTTWKELDCAGAALPHYFRQEIGPMLFRKPPTLSSLKKTWAEQNHEFSATDSTRTIGDRYLDFLVGSKGFVCSVRFDPDINGQVEPVIEDVRRRFQMLDRIPTGSCSNTPECFDWVHMKTEHAIRTADPRDVRAAGGTLDGIRKPELPKWWHFGQYEQWPYEDQMIAMYRTIDAIDLARAVRLADAKTALDTAVRLLAAQWERAKGAREHMSDGDYEKNNRAIEYCANILSTLDNRDAGSIHAELARAIALDSSLSALEKAEKDKEAALRKELDRIKRSAENKNREIKLHAARDDRERGPPSR